PPPGRLPGPGASRGRAAEGARAARSPRPGPPPPFGLGEQTAELGRAAKGWRRSGVRLGESAGWDREWSFLFRPSHGARARLRQLPFCGQLMTINGVRVTCEPCWTGRDGTTPPTLPSPVVVAAQRRHLCCDARRRLSA
uniref:Uncharacterized protein n=1 Tax=Aegilops tauschii subsp. strangulata TaxID=200361 RepID=A0A453FR23_AEGTS